MPGGISTLFPAGTAALWTRLPRSGTVSSSRPRLHPLGSRDGCNSATSLELLCPDLDVLVVCLVLPR